MAVLLITVSCKSLLWNLQLDEANLGYHSQRELINQNKSVLYPIHTNKCSLNTV